MAARLSCWGYSSQTFQGVCNLSRSANTMANVNLKPTFPMAARCKAGRNKLRPVKPSAKKLMIASKVQNIFYNNSMVVVLQYGDLSTTEWEDLRFDLSKNDIGVKIFPNKITHKALENTIYKNIAPLFLCTTCIMYSKEPTVKTVIDLVKKQPKLQLVGAKVENRLLSKSKTEEFAKLPSLQELQGQLVQLLQKPSSNLSYLVEQNQRQLSGNLSQFVNQSQQEQ